MLKFNETDVKSAVASVGATWSIMDIVEKVIDRIDYESGFEDEDELSEAVNSAIDGLLIYNCDRWEIAMAYGDDPQDFDFDDCVMSLYDDVYASVCNLVDEVDEDDDDGESDADLMIA